MQNSHTKKKHTLKGAVLFTVLAVMFVMIILVMTTIALAGAASQKAYSTWFDNQSNYTAQTFVDGVVESLKPGQKNEGLGAKVLAELGTTKGKTVNVDVSADGSSYIPGYGNIKKLSFTYVGDNNVDYNMGDSSISGKDNKIIKVSAEVEMGGETSTYSKYVVGNLEAKGVDVNGGGYNALGSNAGGAGSDTSPEVWGESYAGIASEVETPGVMSELGNDGTFIHEVFYNSSLHINSKSRFEFGRNDPATQSYSGLMVIGDLTIDNEPIFNSQYTIPMVNLTTKEQQEGENISNLPYVYCGGKLTITNHPTITGPMNFYCDTFEIGNGVNFDKSNVFCKGTGVSTIKKASPLIKWVSSVTTTDGADISDMETGNLYTKGSLNIEDSMTIDGDLYVEKDLSIGDPGKLTKTVSLTVNGGVFVKGTLNKYGASNITATNGIHEGEPSFTPEIKDSVSNAFAAKKDMRAPDNSIVNEEVFQSLKHLRSLFYKKDASGNWYYSDAVDSSQYTAEDAYKYNDSNMPSVINHSCEWSGAINGKTININPGPDDLWINLKNVQLNNNCEIYVDDTAGGSCKFFMESGDFSASGVTIATTTYKAAVASPATLLNLEKYPDKSLVPHIYLYAATGNTANVTFSNPCFFTGDILGPDLTVTWAVGSCKTLNIKYLSYTFKDLNNDGLITAEEKINPVSVANTNKKVDLIGSIEVGKMVGITNNFGYIYVDDPPVATGPIGSGTKYSWQTIDGYSTY